MATLLKEVTASPPLGTPAWFVEQVEKSCTEPRMQIVDLNPNLAKFMLDVNADNRSIRNTKVIQYAADMKAGKWALNGEPIIVSQDGNLNDGQHRCLAVVESNTSIPTVLLFGVDRETRLTIDQGAARGASDFLAMDKVPNAAQVAAIARMAIAYEVSLGTSLNQGNYVTSIAIRERVTADTLIAEAAKFGMTNSAYCKNFASATLVGFSYYIMSKVHRDDAKSFLERVCRGDGLKMREPAHTLREKLITEGRLSRDRKLALFIRAWNFSRRGMKIGPNSLNTKMPFPALL